MAAPVLTAGDLDRLVVLQRKATAKNGLGEAVETWVDLAVVWASKADNAGTEQDRAAEVAGWLNTTFFVRYTAFVPPLNPRDRLLFNEDGGLPGAGKIYNIRRVISIGGRRAWHQIDAATRSDQQAS